MVSALLLDALLLLIILLLVPIGMLRGGMREGLVAGGLLLGAALAAAWAEPLGSRLADQTAVRESAGQFFVAIVALVLATILLGYGAGLALDPSPVRWGGRLFGGVLAALNGLLFLGFGVTYVETYLFAGETAEIIQDSLLGRLMANHFGWLLIGGSLTVLLGITLAAVFYVRGPAAEPVLGDTMFREPTLVGPQVAARPRPVPTPVPVPHAADEGKVEPHERGFQADTGRFGADRPRHQRRDTLPVRPAWPADSRSRHQEADRRWGTIGPTRIGNGRPIDPDESAVGEPESISPAPSGAAVLQEWLRRGAAETRDDEDAAGQARPGREEDTEHGDAGRGTR